MDSQRNYKFDLAGAEVGLTAKATDAPCLLKAWEPLAMTAVTPIWQQHGTFQDKMRVAGSTASHMRHPKKVLQVLPVASDGEELACTGASSMMYKAGAWLSSLVSCYFAASSLPCKWGGSSGQRKQDVQNKKLVTNLTLRDPCDPSEKKTQMNKQNQTWKFTIHSILFK